MHVCHHYNDSTFPGGWTNPLISDWFEDYARVIYDLYGDRVKTWLTINEPIAVCDLGYSAFLAPAIDAVDHGSYICNKHVLMAHAKAYRLYEKEYKPKFGGKFDDSTISFKFYSYVVVFSVFFHRADG